MTTMVASAMGSVGRGDVQVRFARWKTYTSALLLMATLAQRPSRSRTAVLGQSVWGE